MASLNVIDAEGKEIEKINIDDQLVKQESNHEILYQEVRRFLASQRSGTHSTKTRSEVRGGGRKPWRQKGTGNARAGTNRSPLWKGGGVVFGPKPRDYSFKLNKKVLKKSKLIALSEKFNQGGIKVLDKLEFDKPSTKTAAQILQKLELGDSKVLLVLGQVDGNTAKSFANIENVEIATARSVNAYLMLVADCIVFSRESLTELVERLTNARS
ncbi:MAG: 50S ribosomal protein L4 [Actinomycetota bacterium]|jgi:large subunit ribosomal protein L4|nr:50S ribosomal protein L4 [Actinomycetota bacterium]